MSHRRTICRCDRAAEPAHRRRDPADGSPPARRARREHERDRRRRRRRPRDPLPLLPDARAAPRGDRRPGPRRDRRADRRRGTSSRRPSQKGSSGWPASSSPSPTATSSSFASASSRTRTTPTSASGSLYATCSNEASAKACCARTSRRRPSSSSSRAASRRALRETSSGSSGSSRPPRRSPRFSWTARAPGPPSAAVSERRSDGDPDGAGARDDRGLAETSERGGSVTRIVVNRS